MPKVELPDSPLSAKSSVKSFAGSAGRTWLSDITNVASHRQKALLKPVSEDERLGLTALTGAKEYTQLLQENAALLKLLEERNGIIERNNLEIRKCKMALQKLQQQNWQLAQTNSLMFAELNLARDRLKSLQHELSCNSVVLKTKTTELEKLKEKMKTNHATYKVDEGEPPPWGTATLADDSYPVAEGTLSSRKRASTIQDLCSSTGNTQPADQDDEQRRSTHRRSSTGLKSQSNENGISNLPEVVEQLTSDQPRNSDLESVMAGYNNECDEQEVKNPTNCKTDLESVTAGCNNGRDEQEVRDSTSCKTEQKQIKSKLKYGRSAVESQVNEPVVVQVKEPPKESIAVKLDLRKRKACQIETRRPPVGRNGRKKKEKIMSRGAAPRICSKDKEHETSAHIWKQNLIILEDSPTGQRESSSSTSRKNTKLTAENAQSENVSVSETDSERQDRKSLPVPTTVSVSETDSERQDRRSLPVPTANEAEPVTGRPSRRATIGISYKERPVNIKMRRPN